VKEIIINSDRKEHEVHRNISDLKVRDFNRKSYVFKLKNL
jgi:hypothetical protein